MHQGVCVNDQDLPVPLGEQRELLNVFPDLLQPLSLVKPLPVSAAVGGSNLASVRRRQPRPDRQRQASSGSCARFQVFAQNCWPAYGTAVRTESDAVARGLHLRPPLR